jgi:hypothetical protein
MLALAGWFTRTCTSAYPQHYSQHLAHCNKYPSILSLQYIPVIQNLFQQLYLLSLQMYATIHPPPLRVTERQVRHPLLVFARQLGLPFKFPPVFLCHGHGVHSWRKPHTTHPSHQLQETLHRKTLSCQLETLQKESLR